MKKTLIATILGAALLGGGMNVAQAGDKPATNVSATKHPNLAEAQRLISQAYDKITAAQAANEYDLQGHAKKAKDLLDQASSELKLAATAANDK